MPDGRPGARRRRSAVAAVVLAGGASTRLAGDRLKQLLRLGGESLVRRAARAALASRAGALVVVVVGCQADRVAPEVADLPCRVVTNPSWRLGQSTSVRAGLAALPRTARAAIFLPCDQPAVDAALLDRLIAAFEANPAPAVYPSYQGRPGSPTLVSRDLFRELTHLTGDTGARALLGPHRERAVAVELDDPAALLDIDTEEAWRLLLE